MISTRSPRLAVALAALSLSCGPGAAPPPLPESAARGAAPDQFSADAAWGHLTALAAVGPRRAGTPGAERARAYLVGALRDPGFEVGEQRAQIEHGGERFTTVNIVAHLPGASPDAILLVAPYDSAPEGAAGVDAGASGAALVVELARALGARRPAYGVWVALV